MAGIEAFGTYVPLFRLPFSELGKAWGTGAGKGERSVANNFGSHGVSQGGEAASRSRSYSERTTEKPRTGNRQLKTENRRPNKWPK